MDRKLPKLLENHIKSLLEEFSVSNWNIKCGKLNTLTIYWKSDSLSANSNTGNYNSTTQSIYKKKPPSQIRRDQRRSMNRKNNTPIPDSGYIKSPGNVNNAIIHKAPDMGDEECSGDISIECIKGGDNVNTTLVSHGQSTVTSPIDNNIACQLDFDTDTTPLAQEVFAAPLNETVHTVN